MNPDLVSVIIPCYKQAHFLPEAVESVLAQSHREIEIIVVDDGSPDNTREVAAEYGSRIRYVHKQNAGLSAARNTGILLATGKWLVYLDADDVLPPNLIQRHLETAATHPDADVTYAAYYYVDNEGRPYGEPFNPRLPAEPFHILLTGNWFPPHSAMTRRSALANAGLFDVRLNSYEDWDMWLRLACAGSRFARTEEPAVPYRQYPTSMSANYLRMRRAGLTVLRKCAAYHSGCAQCRTHLAQGYWGLRSAYLKQTWRQLRRLPQGSGEFWNGLAGLGSEMLKDPLLGSVGVRNSARRLKWSLLGRNS